jgi:hypothetical protein
MSLLDVVADLTTVPGSVVLTEAGRPAAGPRRIPRWQTERGETRLVVRAQVEFGPYPTDALFDGAVLTVAGRSQIVPFTPAEVVVAGTIFVYDIEIRWTRDG